MIDRDRRGLDSNGRDVTALGEHVREREDELLEAQVASEETRRHLAQYVALRRGPSHPRRRAVEWRRRVSLALAAAAALAVVVILGRGLFTSPSLTFSVGDSGRAGVLRALESAPRDGPLPIRFSDGTRVNLDPNARARVVTIGSLGAEIVIESGRAEIDVVPVHDLSGAAVQRPWRVSTGPFLVEVKGTRFDVAWDPNADDFALNLYEGSVVIKGCDGGSGHAIAAGQGVRASCARREWSILALSELEEPPSAAEGSALAAPPETALAAPLGTRVGDAGVEGSSASPAMRSSARAAHAASDGSRARPWQELGRSGHYRDAYQQVLSTGFAAAVARSSAKELMLLGDVARLNGDEQRSRRAYVALRRRFPSDEAAARAAFALGRLEVDRAPRAAARWFDIYLREQPDGPLAQAALERLLELTAALDDREWQREVATAYVRRYPDGPHARDARVLLQRSASRP